MAGGEAGDPAQTAQRRRVHVTCGSAAAEKADGWDMIAETCLKTEMSTVICDGKFRANSNFRDHVRYAEAEVTGEASVAGGAGEDGEDGVRSPAVRRCGARRCGGGRAGRDPRRAELAAG